MQDRTEVTRVETRISLQQIEYLRKVAKDTTLYVKDRESEWLYGIAANHSDFGGLISYFWLSN